MEDQRPGAWEEAARQDHPLAGAHPVLEDAVAHAQPVRH